MKFRSDQAVKFSKIAAVAVFWVLAACLPARADFFSGSVDGVNLGNSGYLSGTNATAAGGSHWAVFSLGGTVCEQDTISGGSSILGNVGVSGNGNFNISGGSTVKGNVVYQTSGSVTVSGGSSISGKKISNKTTDSILSTGVANAKSASSAANNLASSSNYTVNGRTTTESSINGSSNISLSAAAGANVVLHLSTFQLSGGASLTLIGTATTNYIINVAGTFSLGGSSSVVLSGGLRAGNVLFNYTGTNSNLQISGGSTLNGIILAAAAANYNSATVNVSGGSQVNGEIIANTVVISGGSKVSLPSYISQ